MNFVGIKRRPFTAEEEADRRRPIFSAPVVPNVTREEWARAQYRAASLAGAKSKAEFERKYAHSDMQAMEAHVDQIFWQMVRMELRSNPKLQKQLEFIESYYEVPQHEFLERIKNRYWAMMQPMTNDRRHQKFLQEVFRAWHAARLQVEDESPMMERFRQLADQDRQNEEELARRFADDVEMIETLESLRH